MSGLGAIIDWVNDEMDIDPTDTPQEVFEAIDAEFVKENRPGGLANILRDDLPEFMEYIESRLEARPEDRERLEKRIEELESQIEAIERPTEITPEPTKDRGILTKIGNFLKGLFR